MRQTMWRRRPRAAGAWRHRRRDGRLADGAQRPKTKALTHIDASGEARMVDVRQAPTEYASRSDEGCVVMSKFER